MQRVLGEQRLHPGRSLYIRVEKPPLAFRQACFKQQPIFPFRRLKVQKPLLLRPLRGRTKNHFGCELFPTSQRVRLNK
jgi:hypothetical protein